MSAEVVTGIFTLAGVLLGATATHLFEVRSQAKATKLEDDRRWLADRRGIYASFLRLCESLLGDVDGVASMLSYDGDEPLADEVAADIRSEVFRYVGRWHDELQPVLCEVQLLASPPVSDLADRACGGLLAVTEPIEGGQAFTEYYPTWFQARDLIQVVRNAMRAEIGLDPLTVETGVRSTDWPWLASRPSRESYFQNHGAHDSTPDQSPAV